VHFVGLFFVFNIYHNFDLNQKNSEEFYYEICIN